MEFQPNKPNRPNKFISCNAPCPVEFENYSMGEPITPGPNKRQHCSTAALNKLFFGVFFLAIFIFLIALPSFAHAELEDLLKYFQLYISASEEYSSNIDLTPNRLKKSDYITTISPGLRFSTLPRSETTRERQAPSAEEGFGMDLDFRAGFVFYGKEEDNNYTSLNGLLNAWYLPTQNLAFRVRDYLIRSDEIREQDYSVTAIPGQYLIASERVREPYIRNVFEPSAEYRFGRENVIGINYRNNIYEIDSRTPSEEDSVENFINPRLAYWFNIRNGVSFEYGLLLGDFERSADFTGHLAAGRYTYRFNPRTSVFGDFTYLRRDFDSTLVALPGPIFISTDEDYDVYRPTVGLEHAFSPTLSGRIQVGYFWHEPNRGPDQDGVFYDVLFTQRAEKTTYTLAFQGGYAEDYFTAENLGFTKYYRGIGSVTHQLFQRMTVGLTSSLEYEAIPSVSVDQRDLIWGISGSASYQPVKWLTVSLDFGHTENHSNFDTNDYSEYRGMFRITATF
jgi:hypothetical protein